jgi:uncharacterized protein YhjY with autotransporter beta-barrel domain
MSGNKFTRGGIVAAITGILLFAAGVCQAMAAYTLSSGTVGQPYSWTLSTASDNVPPVHFEVVSGSLPPGLTLEVTGPRTAVISGTPTTASPTPYVFDIRVTDSDPVDVVPDYSTFQITVNLPPAPVATDKTASVNAGETVHISIGAGTIAIVAPPSKGTASVSGNGIDYTAGAGSDGNDTLAYTVTDEYGQTSNEGTVTVAITGSDDFSDGELIIPSKSIDATVNEPINEDIGVSGGTGPYTCEVTGGTLPDGVKLEDCRIAGTPTEEGTFPVTVTVTDDDGTTGSTTVTITVSPADNGTDPDDGDDGDVGDDEDTETRPDPADDPEVTGQLSVEKEIAVQLADDQTTSIIGRLESLHDDKVCHSDSINLAVGYSAPDKGAVSLNVKTKEHCSPWSIWATGYVSLASYDSGGTDFRSMGVGMTVGADYRFSPSFVGGVAVGYGRSHANIGDNGTRTAAEAVSAALYASWHQDGWFVDGLLGYQHLRFDNTRYVSANGDLVHGRRTGDQVFGAVLAGYDIKRNDWTISPYFGVRGSSGTLNGYSESGNSYALAYGDQRVSSLSGVLGVRLQTEIQKPWGVLTPSAKLEYRHDFAGDSTVSMGYADTGRKPYKASVKGFGRDALTVGLGLKIKPTENPGWSIDHTLSATFSEGKTSAYVGIRATFRF